MDDYVPKSMLITGGCGFIGSHITEYMVNKYPDIPIVNYDLVDYCATVGNVSECASKENYHFVQGDLLDEKLVEKTFAEYKIDTVLHVAAQSHVDLSFTRSSVQFTKTNVVGTHILLEAARMNNVRRFIHVSTDEVYGEVVEKADENTVMNPTNPYSCSKAAAEMIVNAYIKSYRMPVLITRSNNVYGPKQFPEKVIPKFICRLLRGETCCLHGNGNTKRNFIYVDDVVTAFDCILRRGKNFEVYNIGVDEEVSVLDLSYKLVDDIHPGCEDRSKWLEYVEDRKYNDFKYTLHFDKLEELGWSSKVRFEEGMLKTIEWYKEHHEKHWGCLKNALSAHSWKAYDYPEQPAPIPDRYYHV